MKMFRIHFYWGPDYHPTWSYSEHVYGKNMLIKK